MPTACSVWCAGGVGFAGGTQAWYRDPFAQCCTVRQDTACSIAVCMTAITGASVNLLVLSKYACDACMPAHFTLHNNRTSKGRCEEYTQNHQQLTYVHWTMWTRSSCTQHALLHGRLMDSFFITACRANCIPGYIVPRQELAFSQPTEAGRLFATSYSGTGQFLVYKC